MRKTTNIYRYRTRNLDKSIFETGKSGKQLSNKKCDKSLVNVYKSIDCDLD